MGFWDGEDYRAPENRILGLPFVRSLEYFESNTKATLTFTETCHGLHHVILDSDPSDQTFSLRGIFSKFREHGLTISSNHGAGLAQVLLAALIS